MIATRQRSVFDFSRQVTPRTRKNSPFDRFGFTLVELLVVISIIGVLVSLTLSAVQAAREAARRMSCGNHLRQIGLAVHNYHSTYKRLPRSWWFEYPPENTFNGKPWGYALLPYIEQQTLYERFDRHRLPVDQYSPSSVAAGRIAVPTYTCPSTPESPQSRKYQFDARNAQPAGLPLTASDLAPLDYSPTSGVRSHYARTAYGNAPPPERGGVLPSVAGVFGDDTDRSFAAIFDGLSNTFLHGERTGGATIYSSGKIDSVATANLLGLNGGGWADLLSGEHWLRGSALGGIGWPPQEGDCAINCTSARGYGFHSFHPAGSQFLYADGSVNMITATVDPHRLASGITRRGHEVLSE